MLEYILGQSHKGLDSSMFQAGQHDDGEVHYERLLSFNNQFSSPEPRDPSTNYGDENVMIISLHQGTKI